MLRFTIEARDQDESVHAESAGHFGGPEMHRLLHPEDQGAGGCPDLLQDPRLAKDGQNMAEIHGVWNRFCLKTMVLYQCFGSSGFSGFPMTAGYSREDMVLRHLS